VVADFDGTYHAILGHPSLTKFMVVPHYSYLVLNMPTEKCVLTVRGNVYTAYTYEEESFKVTEAIDLSIRMEKLCPKQHKPHPTSSRYQCSRPQERTSSPKNIRKSSWSTVIPRRWLSLEPVCMPNRKTHSSGF